MLKCMFHTYWGNIKTECLSTFTTFKWHSSITAACAPNVALWFPRFNFPRPQKSNNLPDNVSWVRRDEWIVFNKLQVFQKVNINLPNIWSQTSWTSYSMNMILRSTIFLQETRIRIFLLCGCLNKSCNIEKYDHNKTEDI